MAVPTLAALEEARTLIGVLQALADAKPDDEALVTACEDGVVRVFTDIKSHDGAQSSGTAREGKLLGASGRLHAVDVSADAKFVVTGGQNGTVYLWRDRKLAATLK